MKYLVLLAVLLFQGVSQAHAQEAENLLQAGADAYAGADYQEAIKLYEQILGQGKYAFEVYYNLGNAYFKSDQLGPAILNYERAAKIDPSDGDLQYNLALAQAQTVDKVESFPELEFVSTFKSFVNGIPADRWGVFSIMAFVLLLGAVSGFLFAAQRRMKQLALGLGVLFVGLTVMFLLFGYQQQRWLNAKKEAIVFSPSITVGSTPDEAGEELFVLHEGTKVRVVERFREWVRIRIGDGNTGWVPKGAVVEI